MIVSCPSCDKKYKFSEDKLGKRGAKITCPKCRHVFVVYKDRETKSLGRKAEDGSLESDDRVTQRPPPSRDPWPRDFPTWSFRELGATWRVRKQQGLTYNFFSLEELNGFLDERQVSRTDEISVNGRDWVSIDNFGNLTAYFYDIWKRIESGEIDLDEDEEEEEDEADAPTTIMGAASSLADEIRRAVQDARTPAPASNRVRATPSPATPRGASGRSDGPGYVAPPSPTPSWGGPSEADSKPSWGGPAEPEEKPSWGSPAEPESKPSWARSEDQPGWLAPGQNEEEPTQRFPARPPADPVEGRQGRFSNSPGRAVGVPLEFPEPDLPLPPTPIHDPFQALSSAPSAAPPPKKAPAAPPKKKAKGGGGGGLMTAVFVLLVLVLISAIGGLAGLKLGFIPADLLPIEIPSALLPDESPAVEAPVAPAADSGADTGTEAEGGATDEASP